MCADPEVGLLSLEPLPLGNERHRQSNPRTLTSLRCSFPSTEMGLKKVSVSGDIGRDVQREGTG